MFGLGNIKEKLEEAKLKAEATKARLDSVHVEGKSGEFVTVICTANSQVLQVLIKDDTNTLNKEELSRHMLVATNNALSSAKAVFEAEMGAVARETMPNIPGMPNMGNMFK